MKKYVIIKKSNGEYYASKKLFNIFNIGILGYVDTTADFSLNACVNCLKEYVKRENTKEEVVHEISL
jgi:hypothetical protein